jgi:hypothetical protein
MAKPSTQDGYDSLVTENCERVLVTLLRGLGPWKDSVYLIGGLTPRYLVTERPPNVPPHAGTGDIDIVVKLPMLAETDAYQTLEENLKRMSFTKGVNDKGNHVNWRWQTKLENGAIVILEFLADDPKRGGGKVEPLPTEGDVSALNIPHSSMVFDRHEEIEISAELLGEDGVATETVRYADLISFTCLKALAFDQRFERKDAHDLVYCIEHAGGGLDDAAQKFRTALKEKDGDVVKLTLGILAKRFADDDNTDGYRKDGPVAVAKFEMGEDAELSEPRTRRQRDVSALINALLGRIHGR